MNSKNKISSFSFRNYAWRQLRKNKIAWVSFWIILVLIGIALCSNFIANSQPYFIKVNGHSYFPLFSFKNEIEFYDANGNKEMLAKDQVDWKHLNFESAFFPPVAYIPSSSDLLNADYKSPSEEQYFKNKKGETIDMPFRFRHFLGTNKRGEDVLSGLIHGTSISISVGFFSMLLAGILGIFFGMMAGYFGDDAIKIKRGIACSLAVGLVFSWFYAFQIRSFVLMDALQNSFLSFLLQLFFSVLIFLFVLLIFYFLGKLISQIKWLKQAVHVPLDTIISRLIEMIVSLPTLLLIITIAAISKPSLMNLILIIAFVQWTSIARLIRAEMLRLKQLEFIQAAQAMGLKPWQIMLRHALPNAMAPALVSISFGIASAILIESGLSFLGVGVPVDVVTWGSLINSGRENFAAWWLVLFPGLCIFITALCCNILGEALRDAMDVKQ